MTEINDYDQDQLQSLRSMTMSEINENDQD